MSHQRENRETRIQSHSPMSSDGMEGSGIAIAIPDARSVTTPSASTEAAAILVDSDSEEIPDEWVNSIKSQISSRCMSAEERWSLFLERNLSKGYSILLEANLEARNPEKRRKSYLELSDMEISKILNSLETELNHEKHKESLARADLRYPDLTLSGDVDYDKYKSSTVISLNVDDFRDRFDKIRHSASTFSVPETVRKERPRTAKELDDQKFQIEVSRALSPNNPLLLEAAPSSPQHQRTDSDYDDDDDDDDDDDEADEDSDDTASTIAQTEIVEPDFNDTHGRDSYRTWRPPTSLSAPNSASFGGPQILEDQPRRQHQHRSTASQWRRLRDRPQTRRGNRSDH